MEEGRFVLEHTVCCARSDADMETGGCVAFRRVMGSTLLTIELRLRLRWEVEGEVTAMGDHTQKNAMDSTRICALVVGCCLGCGGRMGGDGYSE